MQLLEKARGVAERLGVMRAQQDALAAMKHRQADGIMATMQAAVAARERELQVLVCASRHQMRLTPCLQAQVLGPNTGCPSLPGGPG